MALFSRQEQFRLCGTLLDGLAAATYTEWVTDRMMTIGGTQVALKDVASCDMTQFKVNDVHGTSDCDADVSRV